MTAYEEKQALRASMQARRREQPAKEAAAASALAQRHLLNAPCWHKAHSIAAYAGVRGEVATDALLEAAWMQGKRLLLPRCGAAPGHMDFVACTSPLDLRPARFGLLEPAPELPPEGADAPSPDLIIVPAVAFDRAGNRLGYGGGYYDRHLARAGAHTTIIGLVFSFQIIDHLPVEPWDCPVRALCTERGLTWL